MTPAPNLTNCTTSRNLTGRPPLTSNPQCAAQQPPANPLAATTGDNALPKNPFSDSQASKPSEPTTSSTSETTNPLALASDVHQPADTPAATANGGSAAAPSTAAGLVNTNGAANESGLAMPKAPMTANPDPLAAETPKDSVSSAVTGTANPFASKSAASTNSAVDGPSDASTSTPGQPPVMTGALPPATEENKSAASAPKPVALDQDDGVKDSSAKPVGALNGDEKKATELKDNAPPVVPASDAASTGAGLGSLSGEKKDIENGAGSSATAATEEPTTTASITAPGEKNDVEMADAAPPVASASTTNPSTIASTTAPSGKEDVEMKDGALPAPSEKPPVSSKATTSAEKEAKVKHVVSPAASAPTPALEVSKPVTGPVADVTGTASTFAAPATATVGKPVAGKKRKADDTDETGGDAAEEATAPPAKKRKGTFAKAVAKAKEAVHDVKEKATSKRKGPKKEKKERLPVGRTERKTRSQAKTE